MLVLTFSLGEAELDPFAVQLVFFINVIYKFLKVWRWFFSHSLSPDILIGQAIISHLTAYIKYR